MHGTSDPYSPKSYSRRGQQVSIVEAAILAKASLERERINSGDDNETVSFDMVEETPVEENYTFQLTLPQNTFALDALGDRVIAGSFTKGLDNSIYIVDYQHGSLSLTGSISHGLPASKILCKPGQSSDQPTLFASTAASLRVWRASDSSERKSVITPVTQLCTSHKVDAFALTSFDWSAVTSTKIATSAADSSVAIWDLEREKLDTQMMAHDKPVMDVAFCGQTDKIIATVGEDGSLRLFDIRDLEHCSILLEDPKPFIRVKWSLGSHANQVAVMGLDSKVITIVDVRKSGEPACIINLATAAESIAWCPKSNLLAVGTRSGALLCDTSLAQVVASLDTDTSGLAWADTDVLAMTSKRILQLVTI